MPIPWQIIILRIIKKGRWAHFTVKLHFLQYLQDKILQGMGRGDTLQVTNDGATILKAIGVDNPAAKVLVGKF